MGILNKLINGFIKFAFVIIGLAIAVVPAIYIYGHESSAPQVWNDSLAQFDARASQVQLVKNQQVSNIFLKSEKTKLSWADANATLQLADYLQHELEKEDITVVKRIVEFKKPVAQKKSKKGEESEEGLQVEELSSLKETPPTRWLKDLIEPVIGFEHQTVKQKHWIIVALGDLDAKFANEIDSIRKNNPLYKFIIVSVWPTKSKLIDIVLIPTPGEAVPTPVQPAAAEEPAVVEQVEPSPEVPKPKKQKKYKVKGVKESKPQSQAQPKPEQL